MRKEFEMTQEQYDRIIEACKPVPYMIIGGVLPSSPQENVNRAWAALGNKAVADAKRAADQVHRERIHAEIADQAHRERIHAEIEADIDLEFDEADRGANWSHTVTQAIAAGRIRHLTINY